MSIDNPIFIEAVRNRNSKIIDREYITHILVDDKTGTIKKYLKSYGITQLAHLLRDIAQTMMSPPRHVLVNVDDQQDTKQKKLRTRNPENPLDVPNPLFIAKKRTRNPYNLDFVFASYEDPSPRIRMTELSASGITEEVEAYGYGQEGSKF